MGQWIEWKGGNCPVGSRTVVDVQLRNGETDRREAVDLYWHRDIPPCDDIVAYRVVTPKPTEAGR